MVNSLGEPRGLLRLGGRPRGAWLQSGAAAVGALATLASATASAEQIDTSSELNLRWDNTVTFTSAFRAEDASPTKLNAANFDDADRNFRGVGTPVVQRGDIYSEVDASWRNFGVRGSAQGWYDAVYAGRNDNNSPGTLNSNVADNRDFAVHTQELNGYNVELMDAFGYGAFAWGDEQRFSFRAGRHTILWGESLYFPTNGISAGQAPLDGIKGQLLLNPQSKETFRPVTQISATYQASLALSFSAYYQLGWRSTVIPGVGSYFSSTDVLDQGGDRLYPGNGGPYFARTGSDIKPPDTTGQFGAAVHYTIGDYDLGGYALRYSDKTPQLLLRPGITQLANGQVVVLDPRQLNPSNPAQIGTYQLAYARNIEIYGASVTTDINDINYGFEISARRNMPLVNQGSVILPAALGGPLQVDADKHAPWPVGDTLHAQLSYIASLPAQPLIGSDDLNITGEVAMNHLLEVTKNKQNLSPLVNSTAAAITTVFEPNYRGVSANLDLAPSIGLTWNFLGNSPVLGNQVKNTAQLTFGLRATYQQVWKGFIEFQHFIGDNHSNPTLSNSMIGRDFIGLSLQRTF